MRTLTSVQSTNHYLVDVQLTVTAADVSTSWSFGLADILNLSPISWEGNMGGGFAAPSNYDVTLSSSLAWIKSYVNKLWNAQTNLKIMINSDAFYPHVGRVRRVNRSAWDLNQITLEIYDRFLEFNPLFPRESLTDSWSTPHPETLANDIGYPIYYGKHQRPFYHFPVDCALGTLIGPRNVSSANHNINSRIWYQPKTDVNTTDNPEYFLPVDKVWGSETNCGNLSVGSNYFHCSDNLTVSNAKRFWSLDFESNIVRNSSANFRATYGVAYQISSLGGESNNLGGHIVGEHVYYTIGTSHYTDFPCKLNCSLKSLIFNTTRAHAYWVNGGLVSQNINSSLVFGVRASGADAGTASTSYWVANYNHWQGYLDIASSDVRALTSDRSQLSQVIIPIYLGDTSKISGGPVTSSCSLHFFHQFKSDAFKKYSIYSPVIVDSDVAISTNPIAIATDILSKHLQIPYVVAQESLSLTQTQSYNLQCVFAERQPVSKILDDFGKITATQYWLGDSGMINLRTYVNSAAVTNSGTINAVITTSDMLAMDVQDNPIGMSRYVSDRASRFTLSYNYDYTSGKYQSVMQADRNNNAYCNSVYASGVDKDRSIKSEYLIETYTASLALANFIKFDSANNQIVRLQLPLRYAGLELSDMIKIIHPVLPNSVSLYQISELTHNYQQGVIQIGARELI